MRSRAARITGFSTLAVLAIGAVLGGGLMIRAGHRDPPAPAASSEPGTACEERVFPYVQNPCPSKAPLVDVAASGPPARPEPPGSPPPDTGTVLRGSATASTDKSPSSPPAEAATVLRGSAPGLPDASNRPTPTPTEADARGPGSLAQSEATSPPRLAQEPPSQAKPRAEDAAPVSMPPPQAAFVEPPAKPAAVPNEAAPVQKVTAAGPEPEARQPPAKADADPNGPAPVQKVTAARPEPGARQPPAKPDAPPVDRAPVQKVTAARAEPEARQPVPAPKHRRVADEVRSDRPQFRIGARRLASRVPGHRTKPSLNRGGRERSYAQRHSDKAFPSRWASRGPALRTARAHREAKGPGGLVGLLSDLFDPDPQPPRQFSNR